MQPHDYQDDIRLLTRAIMRLLRTPGRSRRAPDLMVVCGDEIRSPDQMDLMRALAAGERRPMIFAEFPAVEPLRGPGEVHFLHRGRDGLVWPVSGCSLWTADDGGPLVVSTVRGRDGHYALVDDRFVYRPGPLPGEFDRGAAKARTRVRLAAKAMRRAPWRDEKAPTTADDTCFMLERHEGRLLFIMTTEQALRQGGRIKPLWYIHPEVEEDFENGVVWFGERQALWPRWRRIAEQEGHEALHDQIRSSWSGDPVEDALSIVISRRPDALEVAIQVELVTRLADIGSHRFANAGELDTFMGFMCGSEPPTPGWTQVKAADLRAGGGDGDSPAWSLVLATCLSPGGRLPLLVGEILDGVGSRSEE